MAKKGGKKANKAGKKKSFWSNFFEPVDDFIDEPEEYDAAEGEEAFDGEEGAPAEPPMHLFSDDELDYDEKDDLNAVDSLTWDDGEAVVDDPYALVDEDEEPLPQAPQRP